MFSSSSTLYTQVQSNAKVPQLDLCVDGPGGGAILAKLKFQKKKKGILKSIIVFLEVLKPLKSPPEFLLS